MICIDVITVLFNKNLHSNTMNEKLELLLQVLDIVMNTLKAFNKSILCRRWRNINKIYISIHFP